jgi:hypothetical protein
MGFMPQWIGGVAGAYVFARFALVFPATAIEVSTGLADAWSRTHGNGWRMFIVVGAVPLATDYASGWIYAGVSGPLTAIAASVVGAIFLVFEVAALSLSFRELSGELDGGS